MLEHGGNLKQAAQQYGIPLASWLDLSTGINPNHYPIPEIPLSAWHQLPEDHDDLIEAACQYYGCASALPTAGSQAAIQLLPKLRSTCHIAMLRTMYQEHAHAWIKHGHHVTFFEAPPNIDVLEQADVVLVCNPNNPTGERFSKDTLLQWHQKLARKGAWLIVDEAFMDATPEDSIAKHTHLEGLFVLRSLGKFFGLAGARVGFLLTQHPYLTLAQELIGPWSLTGASRYIATQALLDYHWQDNTRKKLISDSQKLQKMLTLNGLLPIGSTALFQYMANPQALAIQNQLAQHGVWIRAFNQPHAIRLGLPPEGGWEKLDQALKNLSLSGPSI
jgi:cobalamin biosynthesis protein CobC